MSYVQRKLREAHYFCDEIYENRTSRLHVEYNLSAFLSASRSVLYVLSAEYAKAPGFKKWLEDKQRVIELDPKFAELKRLFDERATNTHTKPVNTKAAIKFVSKVVSVERPGTSLWVPPLLRARADGTVEVVHLSDSSSGEESGKTKTVNYEVTWKFEGDTEELIIVCTKGLLQLDNIVSECERKFGKQSPPPSPTLPKKEK